MNEFNLIYDYKQEIQCVKNVHRWIAYESRQNFVFISNVCFTKECLNIKCLCFNIECLCFYNDCFFFIEYLLFNVYVSILNVNV